MNYFKKFGMSITVASILSGCAVTDVGLNENEIDYKSLHENKYHDLPAIQEITTDNYVQKMEHVNHNIKNINVKISTKESNLDDILKMLPLNYQIDKEFRDVYVKQINHNGDLISLLDKLGEMTGLYWTYEKETLTFSRTKIVVYKFPIFSAEKLNLIFNITSDSSDQFNVSSIKTDVFDEIKISLDAIMGEYKTEGSFEESIEKTNTNGNVKENTKLNTDKIQSLDKLVKTLNETKNNDYVDSNVDRLTNNETTLEQSTLNNGFTRNNKEKPGTPATPPGAVVDTKKLLEYDIKKTNNTNGNNESSISKLNGKESKINNIVKDDVENGNSNQKENNNELSLNDKDSVENKNTSKIISLYKKTINPDRVNVSVLKESGMVVVNVDRETEKKVDTVLDSITKNIMSNMMVLDLYIVEANKNKLKKLNSEISRQSVRNGIVKETNIDGTGLTFNRDSLGKALTTLQDAGATMTDGSIITSLVNYTTENSKSNILTNPKILSIPNVPARIKSSIAYPYLDIKSLGGTDSGPEMSVEYVNEGTDIALLSNIYGDDIFISLGVKLNKYLGNQSLNAGTLGLFDVPIQSPRTLNTTFRMKAGEITILGGMKGIDYSKDDNRQMGFLPTNIGSEKKETELLIIAAPRLIKYVKTPTK